MANVKRDDNRVPLLAALLNTDGSTVTPLKANASANSLDSDDDTTGSDNGGTPVRDDNRVVIMVAISEDDSTVKVPLYATSDGELLLDSL